MIRACALVAVLVTAAAPAPRAPHAIRIRVVRFVDRSRTAHFTDGRTGPRELVTSIRIPGGRGPFPLVVFAHGFALTPAPYRALLDAWARAGYVVAAPLFPVERQGAPGGPSERDLVNEPGDIRFVITRVERELPALVDRRRVAVAGQSDGAVAALATAYDRRYRDPRVKAAVILSGAAFAGFTRPPAGVPPLLAVQGTADPINPPSATSAYFALMRRPKFLLALVGASHLPPYTSGDAWASIVRDATTRFLDRYLADTSRTPFRLATTSTLAHLTADP